MNTNLKFKLAAAVAAASILSGCAGYDQWAEDTNKKMNSGWTEMLYGKQTVDKSGMPAGFDIDVRYGKGEGSGIPGPAASKFIDKLTGHYSYSKSCKGMIMFNVNLLNDAGMLVRSEAIMQPGYTANMKVQISKDVFTDAMMQKSTQVTKLVVGNLQCM